MLYSDIITERKYDLPTGITNGATYQQTVLELEPLFLSSRLQSWWLVFNDSYCLFHFRRLRIRTSYTFLGATRKKLVFKRTILVLNCPFLSRHPLVSALVQSTCLCWRLCNRHLRGVKTWQPVLEVLCVLRRRPAVHLASRNWWGLKGWAGGSRDFANVNSF